VPTEFFHPAVSAWFRDRFGEPTAPQREGWPLIRAGENVLIAAPTGSGKTLAGFLSAIDGLFRQGALLPDETQVVYVSPLRALSNDVQKNLQGPLAEIRALDPVLPEVRVLVRTGDTKASDRSAMTRRPPHILVTTPESLYLLLTSEGGRSMLRTTRAVIVDEIHALIRDKRGAHLALSLERLDALTDRPVQRLGLSATQKPLDEVGSFLAGVGRACRLVDAGTFRTLDLEVEVPPSPLGTVCSHEQWDEIYSRLAALVQGHRTTLVFVNTRKMAERIAAHLTRILGEEAVTSHHGSLAKERRLDAEMRLKAGSLRALVATASLELGIDIGEVDLVVQVGATRSIATLLQRVGRSGHALGRVPKGRLFPLTLDELVEAAALLRCVRSALLDRTAAAPRPLDILAQQVVAECVARVWGEDSLFAMLKRAWPYRDLAREEFDEVVRLHSGSGRRALLHRDGVGGRLRATRRARLTALQSGGAIPDTADYQVRLEPDGTLVGTVNEDWAIESNGGDIFQLGNASWRILRVEPGTVRVADAKGQPPSLPFWLGEGPGRTRELSAAIAALRETCAEAAERALAEGGAEPLAAAVGHLRDECGEALGEPAALQIAEYVLAGLRSLGCVPTERRVVLERFFDEAGGTQLVVHAPFGSRINRAWGLALRKRFCVGFGFELQAAANEEAIVLSLGPQHSFPLEEVFDYLHPQTARDVLVQALLAAPMFGTRWRWNAQRSLMLDRSRNGKRVPAALLRMRAEDLLVEAFPQVLACPETLPGGPIPVPEDHPIVRQTVEDCLTEAMDVHGFLEVLRGLRDGSIERRAIDTPEPSAFARGILSSQPYTFLDDAPLEERRTQAVMSRRILDPRTADELGALDPSAVARVREEAWPRPENGEEVHEALSWMGYVTVGEAGPWCGWLDSLQAAGRVLCEGDRFFAVEASRDPKETLRGRLEALGPVFVETGSTDEGLLRELEAEGTVLRTRIDGREAWCDRRLLARIHRYTLDRLRREIEPVTATQFLDFLACWQHVDPEHHVDGPKGVAEVIEQLAGYEIPAAAWEGSVLPARVRGYRREWLDQLTLSGDIVWGRFWGAAQSPVRRTPVALVPRADLESWTALAAATARPAPLATAEEVLGVLRVRGAVFVQDIARFTRLPLASVEEGLGALVAQGRVTCDSFSGLRWLLLAAWRRKSAGVSSGRWNRLGPGDEDLQEVEASATRRVVPPAHAEFAARRLLRRTGVVFRRTASRERIPVPWRDIVRACRTLEARGEVRGGRFVAGFDGEQFALPEAVTLLRKMRRKPQRPLCAASLELSAADPLNFQGILTPFHGVCATADVIG
jgi:ATP-dependent helicase Lhr and Lhr-like helicase